MIEDLKKEFSSLRLLIALAIISLSIYLAGIAWEFIRLFSDTILILLFGWFVSFLLEPFADLFTKYLRLPRIISTVLVFLLAGILITISFIVLIPNIVTQFNTLAKEIPMFVNNSPAPVQRAIDNLIGSFNNYTELVPSLTSFLINLVIVLILSFYLVVDKDNLNRHFFAVLPKRFHANTKFIQKTIDDSFASFVRIQILWGFIGGIVTWITLNLFHIPFAASTSIMAGVFVAVPVIGPIIGLIPPLLVTTIEAYSKLIPVFLVIFLVQQFIFNVFGPKIMGKAFNLNPIIVMLALLIGIRVAGFTGAMFAVPVVSIALIVGKEFYNFYFKDKELA